VSILDVLDNFLSIRGGRDVIDLSGREIWQLGEEVRRFASSYSPPPFDTARYPMYLGGWPSANFFVADQGQLMLSSLLYAGQVLVKDPVSDWFSREQYSTDQMIMKRPGYLLAEEGKPNIAGTRRFLATVVPALQILRPLIQSGAVILVSAEPFFAAHHITVDDLRAQLLAKLARNPETITRRFNPADLVVDDRCRGMFVFAGGEKEKQLREAIDRSLWYFSREWLLSQAYGVEYAAPWTYEQFVCEEGLGELLLESPHQRTTNALLHSRLPVFNGLTPIVADVRDDDAFASFRTKLYEVYEGIPKGGSEADFTRILAQTEETLLRPVLRDAEQAAKHGFLSRLGVGLTEFVVSLGARVAYDTATHQIGWNTAVREGVGLLADRVRIGSATRSPVSVWTKLYKHHRKIADELRLVQIQPGSEPEFEVDPWHIDDEPSMELKVAPGALLFDETNLPEPLEPTGYKEGNYRPCDCGSGLKWKFCCQTVPTTVKP